MHRCKSRGLNSPPALSIKRCFALGSGISSPLYAMFSLCIAICGLADVFSVMPFGWIFVFGANSAMIAQSCGFPAWTSLKYSHPKAKHSAALTEVFPIFVWLPAMKILKTRWVPFFLWLLGRLQRQFFAHFALLLVGFSASNPAHPSVLCSFDVWGAGSQWLLPPPFL